VIFDLDFKVMRNQIIDILDELCVQLTRGLFAIAKFLLSYVTLKNSDLEIWVRDH